MNIFHKLCVWIFTIVFFLKLSQPLAAQKDTIIIFDHPLIKNQESNLFRFSYQPKSEQMKDSSTVLLRDSLLKRRFPATSNLELLLTRWFPDGVPTEKIKRLEGYRIMIYRGNQRKGASVARGLAYEYYDQWRSYLSFKTPNFIVKIGNFATKTAAEKARQMLNKRFQDAALVPDRITIWYKTYLNDWE